MSQGNIRIGIGGWTFAPWRGVFYPPGTRHADEFDYAVAHTTTIEINATFYKRQKPASFYKWGAAAPDGYKFALKASRYAISRPKLAEAEDALAFYFAQGMSELGDRLGPILWQFADHRQFDADDMAGFMALLPDTLDGVPVRHVIEPRHDSFADPAFYALARKHRVAVAFADSADYPCIDADTTDFRYARLQRTVEHCPTGYDDAALDHWVGMAREWAARGDAFVYVIGGAKVRNPAAAQAMIAKLG